jgi:hypothetical protein
MTKEERLKSRREYYAKTKDRQNQRKRDKYANGDSWYHKKQTAKFLI